jgi:multisubunit Na+/H+ antiporter MnhB subunit
MLEAATFASTFLAFALLHGAEPRRRPARFRTLGAWWSPAATRATAGLLLAASVGQWTRVEGLSAAFLVVAGAFSLAATLFVLLVPLLPRVIWGVALASAPAALVLSLLGGRRG